MAVKRLKLKSGFQGKNSTLNCSKYRATVNSFSRPLELSKNPCYRITVEMRTALEPYETP